MYMKQIIDAVAQCSYPGYEFDVIEDKRGAIYLQGSYYEADVKTGIPEKQVTRRWFLNPQMVKSEVVQTVFKCVITSMEHRAREWFTYRGRNIFGPHFDVDALWQISDGLHVDARFLTKEQIDDVCDHPGKKGDICDHERTK